MNDPRISDPEPTGYVGKDDFEVCGHRGPSLWEPCCREKGHDDGHWYWLQSEDSKYTTQGLRVYEEPQAGCKRYEARWFFELAPGDLLTPAEVAAVVAYAEWAS